MQNFQNDKIAFRIAFLVFNFKVINEYIKADLNHSFETVVLFLASYLCFFWKLSVLFSFLFWSFSHRVLQRFIQTGWKSRIWELSGLFYLRKKKVNLLQSTAFVWQMTASSIILKIIIFVSVLLLKKFFSQVCKIKFSHCKKLLLQLNPLASLLYACQPPKTHFFPS